jgi:protein Tex
VSPTTYTIKIRTLSEHKLSRSLHAVVEDCVNAVGVDVNTASTPLLSQVSGIGEGLAHSIVTYREAHGSFRTRAALKKVPRLGPKAFELSAGFLRIRSGDDPLDASGVHPEAYPVVRRILAATKSQLGSLIGNTPVLRQLEPEAFTDPVFGVPTVTDILRELEKPGRDPRPAYKTANFREGVEKLEDLKPGMVLEGVVTNVAAFGAFVDVGVHQDGLVHISAMANAYVKDPRKVAKPGDVVRVKVLEVEPKRRRISLTMRLHESPGTRPTTARAEFGSEKSRLPTETRAGRRDSEPATGDAMAEAFRRAGLAGKIPGRQ